ncbi:hypothetical protein [Sunxiuqinia dokdonensis]|nr:hypothetical protein [Sunxiuqinia dokdonensis]
MKYRKEIVKLILIAIPLIGFIAYGFIVVNKENKKLEKDPAHTYGIIIKKYIGAKARDYVKYEYKINGQIYLGDKNYMPHKELIRIGDTCEVIYAKSDPEISKLIENDDGTIKIRKSNELKGFNLK